MSEGVMTVAMTYEISGIPALAVRVGQALENWGARAGRRADRDELALRYERQLAHDAVVEQRRNAYSGMYSILR